MLSIDLNADLGEGCGDDAALMPWITSCNIACGGHAGNAASMAEALVLAKTHGVVAGTHPSYPDREGFGRRALAIDLPTLEASLQEQLQDAAKAAAAAGTALRHVKPHGALYNAAAADHQLADVIARAVTAILPGRHLVGPPQSELQQAAVEQGLPFIAEGFMDRRYLADGALQPRSEPGSVLHDQKERLQQTLALARGEDIHAVGGMLNIKVQTICLHGDSDGAAETARLTRLALEEQGIKVRAPHG
ncbi:MAG: 5-oxoprolinase subunit PxpA [Parvularculaceae bacterium]|nr:5-oxoprolinase subunit PxpA [Parvularculaceae bacterium]